VPAGAALAGTGSGEVRAGVKAPRAMHPLALGLCGRVSLVTGWSWVPRRLRDPPGALQPGRDGAGLGDERVDDAAQAAAAVGGALPCR